MSRESNAAAAVIRAIEKSIKDSVATKDMGGTAGISKVGTYIAECVKKGKKFLINDPLKFDEIY